jgi:hypothetical protein
MQPTSARWGTMQCGVLADTTTREADRVVRALADAHPLLLDRARLFAADARALAAAARALRHAVEAATGTDDDAA